MHTKCFKPSSGSLGKLIQNLKAPMAEISSYMYSLFMAHVYSLYLLIFFFFLYSLTFSSCHFSFPSFPFCSFWAWVKLAQPLSYYGFSSPLVVLLALLSISFQCRLFFSWILSKSTADQSHTQHFIWGIWLGAMNNTKLPFSPKWLHWSCISP